MKALVQNGRVVQVEEEPFEVHPSLVWVDIPDGLGVKPEWTYEQGVFTNPKAGGPTRGQMMKGLEGLLFRRLVLAELGEDTSGVDQSIADLKARIPDK